MDPIIGGALIGGASSIIGGIFGDNSAKKAAARAAAANERQLKNQHQWEVADLRKAGLNPILSGTGGGGSGTIATPVAQTGNTGRGIAEAGRRLLDAKLMQAQIDNLDQDSNLKFQQQLSTQIDNTIKSATAANQPTAINLQNSEARGRIQKIADELLEIRTRTSGTAKDNQAKDNALNAIKADPLLQKYIMSVPYAEREQLNEILTGGGSQGDVWKLIGDLTKFAIQSYSSK